MLYELAEQIMKVNFDERVKEGDWKLVNELTEWTKKNLNKKLFSFVTKYCAYHNMYCYGRDDFVIYDSVIAKNILKYVAEEQCKSVKNKLAECKRNYKEYVDIIDLIIKQNNITVEKPRRKVDLYIWNRHKKRNSGKENNKDD